MNEYEEQGAKVKWNVDMNDDERFFQGTYTVDGGPTVSFSLDHFSRAMGGLSLHAAEFKVGAIARTAMRVYRAKATRDTLNYERERKVYEEFFTLVGAEPPERFVSLVATDRQEDGWWESVGGIRAACSVDEGRCEGTYQIERRPKITFSLEPFSLNEEWGTFRGVEKVAEIAGAAMRAHSAQSSGNARAAEIEGIHYERIFEKVGQRPPELFVRSEVVEVKAGTLFKKNGMWFGRYQLGGRPAVTVNLDVDDLKLAQAKLKAFRNHEYREMKAALVINMRGTWKRREDGAHGYVLRTDIGGKKSEVVWVECGSGLEHTFSEREFLRRFELTSRPTTEPINVEVANAPADERCHRKKRLRVRLFQRGSSRKWRARFRIKSGEQIEINLKTPDHEHARMVVDSRVRNAFSKVTGEPFPGEIEICESAPTAEQSSLELEVATEGLGGPERASSGSIGQPGKRRFSFTHPVTQEKFVSDDGAHWKPEATTSAQPTPLAEWLKADANRGVNECWNGSEGCFNAGAVEGGRIIVDADGDTPAEARANLLNKLGVSE